MRAQVSAGKPYPVGMAKQAVRPLDEREMSAWHALIQAHSKIVRRLESELETEHGLSLPAYEVLAHLSMAPESRLRMSELAGHAVLKTMCGYDPAKLIAFACRFTAPVFPGETLRTEMWRDGAVVSFRTRVVERDAIAVNNGRAEVKS